MRLKTVKVSDTGYLVSARNGIMLRVGGRGKYFDDLSLEVIDKVLAHLEALTKAETADAASQLGYPDFPYGEYSGEQPRFVNFGTGAQVKYGCTYLGVEQLREMVKELHEVNKDPEMKPDPNERVVDLDEGYYVTVKDGYVWLCDADGTPSDKIISLEGANKFLAEMEHRKTVGPMPQLDYNGSTPNIRGYGSEDENVTLSIACQQFDLATVRETLEVLNKPTVKTEPVV